MELCNSQITIMRGTAVNDAGDETDVGTPVYEHVPAALVEKSHTTFDRASSTRRTIRTWMCVLPDWADITIDDTIMDEGTTPPSFFMVEDIQRQPSLGLPSSLILTLRMRSGVSITSD